ncbi:MAG: hypothetical protein IKU58_08195, partial [Clostridia bacterium]|nr:hypothetical protein [Clostridia bacterium]
TTPTTPAEPTPEVDPDAWKYGGTVTIGHGNAPSTMDAHTSTVLGDEQWYYHVYESLACGDANGKYYGVIADYKASDDGLVHTYTLRDDRYFANGDKVTMEDVEASIRRKIAVGITTESSANMWLTDCTFDFSDTQLVVTLAKFNVKFQTSFNSGTYVIMPKEICEKYPYEGGTELPNGMVYGASIPNVINTLDDVIGSGPYTMTKFTDNADIVLTKNEAYIPVTEGNEDAIGIGAPRMAYLDEIIFSLNLDAASRTAAMIAHEYDRATIQASMKDAAIAAGIQVGDAGTTWTHGIFFNLHESNADSPIADVNVRKAIRCAIDVEEVMLAICGGDASRINLDPYAVRNETVYASTKMEDSGEWNVHDVEKAKAYLAQSNYNGEPIVYLTHTSGAFYTAAMVIIPQLEAIGLNVELMAVENSSHGALRKDPATGHDIGCWEVQKSTENPVLHSTFVTGTQGWWTTDARNNAVNKMLNAPTGSAESLAAYDEYLDAVIDECPYILFGHPTGLAYQWPGLEHGQAGQSRFYYWNAYFTDKQ